jgi:uncharacterized sulfatase
VGALAPWILLSATPFPIWATSGMETLLFTAAATAALAAQARGRIAAASFWLSVATLTRPEGALLALVVFVVHFTTTGTSSPASRGIRSSRALVPVLAWLAVPALLTVFRLAYYGSPLPNTFYAKVGGIPMDSGLAYLTRFLADGSLVLVPAALVVVGDRRWWAGIAWVLALSVYVVAIGGDAFGQWRFLVPCLPVLAALSLRGVLHAFTVSRWAGAALALTVPGAVLWMVFGGAAQDEFPGGAARWDMIARVDQGNRNFEEIGRKRAELLRAETPAPRLVASGAIGSFGYYSRLPILDYFGIVDPVVARSPASEALPGERRLPGHHRSNAEYVFSRRPDVLLVPDKSRGLRFQRAGGILDLWSHPAFDAYYAWDKELGGYRALEMREPSDRPNLVLIISDDQGYEDQGFMGSDVISTPHLDRLARGGVVFTTGYSTASLCRPALNSLLTGLDPQQWERRVSRFARKKDPNRERPPFTEIQDFETLPRLLAQRGYTSFQAGKHWEGTYATAGFTDGMTRVKRGPSDLPGGAGLALVRETLDPVLDFVDANLNRPFFLWFAPMLPHPPHDAPDTFLDRYKDAGLDPRLAAYYANISRLDAGVGELLAHLDRRGLRERTVVVYLADNGWQGAGYFDERNVTWGGAAGKGSLYELGFRTPIVVSGPGLVPEAARRHALVSLLDVFPTLLDYAGIVPPGDRPGSSLRPIVEGKTEEGHPFLTGAMDRVRADTRDGRWLGPEPGEKRKPGPLGGQVMVEGGRFLRDERWHYLWYRSRPDELYDLATDPVETRNVADTHPEVVERNREHIRRWEAHLKALDSGGSN